MVQPFPQTPAFSGWNAPVRVECDIGDLVVEGRLPEEIAGRWYRLTPDPMFPPRRGDDAYWSGDGMISRFVIAGGRASYRARYLQTERLRNDIAAGRSLYGDYRNPYTDDPRVAGMGRGTNNTTPIWHGGRLLALKEDSRALEVDPETLATRGEWNYHGRLRSQTMTAHPRLDPDTGELFFFGYEAAGLATREVAYAVADRHGELLREEWFEAPHVSFMHDFVVTKRHVVFAVFPFTCDLQRMQSGGPHWQWTPALDTRIGIMPRDAGVDALRWFRGPAVYAAHFLHGHSEGDRVHVDFDYDTVTPLSFGQASGGAEVAAFAPASQQIGRYSKLGRMVRWSFDLARPGEGWEERRIGPGGNFGSVAARDLMRDYRIAYYSTYDPAIGPRIEVGPVGVGMNAVLRVDVEAGTHSSYSEGPRVTFQEHVHIASKQVGHEGWLLLAADRHDEQRSEVLLLEAAHLERGPVARIQMPLRLRSQIHGNWYDEAGFAGAPARA